MATDRHRKILRLTQFSVLLVLELILVFTPIGLIMVPPVAVTLLHIPVIVCGVIMGAKYGMLMGGVFGVSSMVKATTMGTSPLDLMFSPFHSGNPVASVLMAFVCRVLLGLIAGVLYNVLAGRIKNSLWAIGITAVVSTALHTLTVLTCMWLFFREVSSVTSLMAVIVSVFSVNCGLEILSAVAVAVPVCKPLLRYRTA